MNKTVFLLPLLLISIICWRAQASTAHAKMATDIRHIANIEPIYQELIPGYGAIPMPLAQCASGEVMTGIEVQRIPAMLDSSSSVATHPTLINFLSVNTICSPLKLNKHSLQFKTTQVATALNRITCKANQVVVGINAWDSSGLYSSSQASNRQLNVEDNLSAIQLTCAPLKLTGDSWIGVGEIEQSSILGQPSGELVVDRLCSNPGQTAAAGISGLKRNTTSWLTTNNNLLGRLHEIRLHCSTLFPELIDANLDTDNDGINNREEAALGVSFLVEDTDQDGVSDRDEIYLDSDADGKVNAIESAIADQDLDGIVDEQDSDDHNPCIPIMNAVSCPVDPSITTDAVDVMLPKIPANAINEQCLTGLDGYRTRLEYSCFIDGFYASSWRAHYNDTSWGLYSFSWRDSRYLGSLLGGYYWYHNRSRVNESDLTILSGIKFQKTVRRFQDGSKATGVWGGEIKRALQQARPMSTLSADYYTGTERWEDYIGMMYFDKHDQLEAITLSKQGDDKGRTFVVKTEDNVRKLFIVDEDYIYNHSK